MTAYKILAIVISGAMAFAYLVAYVLDFHDDEKERKEDE